MRGSLQFKSTINLSTAPQRNADFSWRGRRSSELQIQQGYQEYPQLRYAQGDLFGPAGYDLRKACSMMVLPNHKQSLQQNWSKKKSVRRRTVVPLFSG